MNRSSRSSRFPVVPALVAVAVAAVAAWLQIGFGSYESTGTEVWAALTDSELWGHPATLLRLVLGDSMADMLGTSPSRPLATPTLIVWSVRVPRVVLALIVGMNLGIAGTVFQGITRNELAGPYLLGVSAGAGLAVLIVLVLIPEIGPHLPLIAGLGGMASFLIVYGIAWHHGTSSVRLVLAGVIVAAIGGAVQTALFLLIEDLGSIHDAVSWTTGTLTGADWQRVRIAFPWTVIVVALALASSRHLDVLLLGDERARALGMRAERARFLLAGLAVFAAASTIAVAGMIAFVGLIVPHIVRTVVGPASRALLLGCLLVGPAIMLTADAVARLLFSPAQIPVGLVTGIVGGGYFLYLMRRTQYLIRP